MPDIEEIIEFATKNGYRPSPNTLENFEKTGEIEFDTNKIYITRQRKVANNPNLFNVEANVSATSLDEIGLKNFAMNLETASKIVEMLQNIEITTGWKLRIIPPNEIYNKYPELEEGTLWNGNSDLYFIYSSLTYDYKKYEDIEDYVTAVSNLVYLRGNGKYTLKESCKGIMKNLKKHCNDSTRINNDERKELFRFYRERFPEYWSW